VGLGKTHLMHAIAQEVVRREPDARVLYLSAERFLNDLINALRFERMHEFKRRYRELDVLLMDDVQFIAGRTRRRRSSSTRSTRSTTRRSRSC
jgi:chromosomal replication initiator protein